LNHAINKNQYIRTMPQLAKRITELSESATIKMAQLSRELIAKGIDIISLSLGEPDFEPPQHIQSAAKRAIDDGYSHYPPVQGYADVRAVICEKFRRDQKFKVEPNQIIISTGAKQSLANLMLVLVEEGDEVIMPSPYWVSYEAQIELAEGTLVKINASIDNDFKITAAQLEAAITPKTKAFLFSSPCNPTGSVYSKKELESLKDVFVKHPHVAIISDEIYEHINFIGKHESISQFTELHDRLVIVNGLSKGFAMTGWRLGYIAAPKYIADACNKMQGQFTSGANCIAQRACIAALTGSMEPTNKMRAEFLKRRDLAVKMLREIPNLKVNEPEGAFYIFPDCSGLFGKKHGDTVIENADDLCTYLINEAHVSVVTGRAFGADNNFRLSYATATEKLVEAIERMKTAIEKLS